MTDLEARQSVKRVELEAVVIRADGRRHDLGVISGSSRWWRFTPSGLLARWRTHKANREVGGG